jgi:hypothetical protein
MRDILLGLKSEKNLAFLRILCYHNLTVYSRCFRFFASQSRRRRVYHPQLVAVYYKPRGLDIIKPQGNTRWRVMICTALRAAMICQACGLDKQKTEHLS